MQETIARIQRDIEDDGSVHPRGLDFELRTSGLFRKKKTLRLSGTVRLAGERERILRIVRRHVGPEVEIVDQIRVGAAQRAT